ncbi:hypothetical protein [Nostoc sp.]|uniref:hypothetical protein n=1 Tax=Nostoc sp. TaxID=1180 RepID=UPI002FFAE0D3
MVIQKCDVYDVIEQFGKLTVTFAVLLRRSKLRAASRREVQATPTQHLQQQCSILEKKGAEVCKPTS